MIDVSVTRVGEVAVFSRDVRGRTVVKLQGACAGVSRDRPGAQFSLHMVLLLALKLSFVKTLNPTDEPESFT